MDWTPFKVWLAFVDANTFLWGKIVLHPQCGDL